MSDFEIISVILMMISIIITILLAYIENTKKVTTLPKVLVTFL